MDDIKIVKIEPSEWQLYKALRLEALKAEPQAYCSTYEEESQAPDSFWQARLEEAKTGDTGWLLFAKKANKLIGTMGAYRKKDDDFVNIVGVYVTSNERGKGVGKKLMEALLTEIKKNSNIKKACLCVSIEQKPAINLYQNLGFKIVGRENKLMGDQKYYEEYIMENTL